MALSTANNREPNQKKHNNSDPTVNSTPRHSNNKKNGPLQKCQENYQELDQRKVTNCAKLVEQSIQIKPNSNIHLIPKKNPIISRTFTHKNLEFSPISKSRKAPKATKSKNLK